VLSIGQGLSFSLMKIRQVLIMTCFFFFFLAAGDGWKVPFNTRERFSQEFDNQDTDYDGFVGGTFPLGSLVVIVVHLIPLAFFF